MYYRSNVVNGSVHCHGHAYLIIYVPEAVHLAYKAKGIALRNTYFQRVCQPPSRIMSTS